MDVALCFKWMNLDRGWVGYLGGSGYGPLLQKDESTPKKDPARTQFLLKKSLKLKQVLLRNLLYKFDITYLFSLHLVGIL